jgi:hypothetical protein
VKVNELFKKPNPKPVEFTGAAGVFYPALFPIRDEVRSEWSGREYTTDDLIEEVVARAVKRRTPLL